jgi:peptidoglycan/xylan/chitin deacetylase (PgdA/CDA1 family)
MQATGLITIGSHCLGPEPLINIKSEQELKKEIFDSKRIIEDKLGIKVNTFSYPEGRFDPRIRQLVIDAGYTVAVATNPGRDSADRDLFALKRLRISENCANMLSFAGVTSGFYTFMKEYKKHRHAKK